MNINHFSWSNREGQTFPVPEIVFMFANALKQMYVKLTYKIRNQINTLLLFFDTVFYSS